jgi:hypothetical protein
VVTLVMAWSPARCSNAGRFEVEHPGDYAAFNSYQPGYGTSLIASVASESPPQMPFESVSFRSASCCS